MLEAREEVEATEDPERLLEILAGNRKQQAAVVRDISAAFREGALHAAADATTKLTYLVRLEQEVVAKMPLASQAHGTVGSA